MDELLTPREAAAIAKVSIATIYRWRAEGRLETVPFGRLWRVRRSTLMGGLNGGGSRSGSRSSRDPDREQNATEVSHVGSA